MSKQDRSYLKSLLFWWVVCTAFLYLVSCQKTEVIEETPRVDNTACVKCHGPFVYEYVKAKLCIDCHHGVDQLTNIDTCRYAGFKRII